MEGVWGGRWKIKKVEKKEEEEEATSMEGLVASVQRLRWERDAVSGKREGGREGRRALRRS